MLQVPFKNHCWRNQDEEKDDLPFDIENPQELQTRAPWTEVKSAQMTKSCLAELEKAFGRGAKSLPKVT